MEIDRLLGCAYGASLFRNGEGVPFALIPGEATDQSDVAFLHSREFASFLREKYYAQYGRYPKDALLRIVRDLLDRRAYRGEAISAPVAPRVLRGVAERAGEPGQSQVFRPILALDLGRCSSAAPNSVLEIDADGWSVSHSNGFAFLRARGHLPVPPPERAGAEALAELKNLLRVDHDDWLRIVTWLLVAMRANGPYPILVLQGEPASGKTQAAKMLKSLLDPAAVPFLPLPTNPNTLLRQANQSWIQAFDHVTAVPKPISAALCRLSTSASFNLMVDGSPITVGLARPIVMTVPTSVAGAAWKPRGDLLDRMLTVTLPRLTDETTRPESEIADRFAKARPKILGALAQAVSVAMARVHQIDLASYPRHAGAAVWAIAASPALNISEESLQQALEQKSQFHIPKDPLLQKVATLMATREDWQGTATKLKVELDLAVAPNYLSRKLKDVKAILQDQGIEIAFPPRQANGQTIRITKVLKVGCNSRSVADLPVDSVESTSMPATPMTVPHKIHRQIVSDGQNKEETMTLADRQAANGTAPPTEMPPGSGAIESERKLQQHAAGLLPPLVLTSEDGLQPLAPEAVYIQGRFPSQNILEERERGRPPPSPEDWNPRMAARSPTQISLLVQRRLPSRRSGTRINRSQI